MSACLQCMLHYARRYTSTVALFSGAIPSSAVLFTERLLFSEQHCRVGNGAYMKIGLCLYYVVILRQFA